MDQTLTTADLLAFARSQARIESIDYLDPYERRAERIREGIRAWRGDRSRRDRARRNVFRTFPARTRSSSPLIPGGYGCQGRLVITADGIDYTAGQYSALEIWPAVLDYFERTNGEVA